MPIDPQRPGQPGQGWALLAGIVVSILIVVGVAIWASHQG